MLKRRALGIGVGLLIVYPIFLPAFVLDSAASSFFSLLANPTPNEVITSSAPSANKSRTYLCICDMLRVPV